MTDPNLPPPPPIPPQTFAPHVEIDEAGRIVFAPPAALDAEGNNLPRLRSLLPDLIDIADELAALLARGNQAHATLQKRLAAYRARLHPDLAQVDPRRVLAEGLRLESAATATDARINAGDLPPLDAEAHEALASLLRTHRLFVMATADGPAMLAEEARYNRSREEEAAHQANMRAYAAAVARTPEAVADDVRETLSATVAEPGDSLEASRTRLNGDGLGLNIAIVAAGGATLAAAVTALGGAAPPGTLAGTYAANLLSILGGSALGNSRAFQQTQAALGDAWTGLARHLGPASRLLANTRGALSALARERQSRFAWLLPTFSWLDGIEFSVVGAITPPEDFSHDEVKRRLLAGDSVPSAWRPLVRELDFSVDWVGRLKTNESVRQTYERVWEEFSGEVLRDVTPLTDFPNLTSLSIKGTPITDLAPLAKLTTLQHLNLMDTEVTDLAPIAGLLALRSFDLWGTKVSALTPLATLTALQSLDLRHTQVTDLAPLATLTTLQSLNLERTQVTDLTALAGLTALQSLILRDTKVTDLAPLGGFTALKFLDLTGTQVFDLAPLFDLTALQSLDLRGTQVTDLAPLATLNALQSLFLNRTKVTDLSPLATLTALRSLDLARTQVTDLAPLAALPNLRELTLTGLPLGIEAALPRRAEIDIKRYDRS